MPDLDDFHAFKSTGGGAGGPGCAGSFIVWLTVILVILWIIGKLFG